MGSDELEKQMEWGHPLIRLVKVQEAGRFFGVLSIELLLEISPHPTSPTSPCPPQSPFSVHKLLDSMWGSGCIIFILSDPADGWFSGVPWVQMLSIISPQAQLPQGPGPVLPKPGGLTWELVTAGLLWHSFHILAMIPVSLCVESHWHF